MFHEEHVDGFFHILLLCVVKNLSIYCNHLSRYNVPYGQKARMLPMMRSRISQYAMMSTQSFHGLPSHSTMPRVGGATKPSQLQNPAEIPASRPLGPKSKAAITVSMCAST